MELIGFLGPNGAGKTTLMRCVETLDMSTGLNMSIIRPSSMSAQIVCDTVIHVIPTRSPSVDPNVLGFPYVAGNEQAKHVFVINTWSEAKQDTISAIRENIMQTMAEYGLDPHPLIFSFSVKGASNGEPSDIASLKNLVNIIQGK